MNKTYEIEYHLDGDTLTREVVTADGRTTRHNRIPTTLLALAEAQAQRHGAYRYQIRLIKLPHVTASGVTPCVTHLIYESVVEPESV